MSRHVPALKNWLRENWSLAFLVAVIGLYFVLRTSPTEGIDSLQVLEASLQSGQPVVLEFYSNLWSTCLVAKPVVDRIEEQLSGKAQVIRLNMLSRVGQQAAARYGVRGMPTLVVVDGNGEAVYGRYGIPAPGPVIDQVDTLLASNWGKLM